MMNSSDSNLAAGRDDTFLKIRSCLDKNLETEFQRIFSINQQAKEYPYYISCSFSMTQENEMILGVLSQNIVFIIYFIWNEKQRKMEKEISKKKFDPNRHFQLKGLNITSFTFKKKVFDNLKDNTIFIGFENGIIAEYSFQSESNVSNLYNYQTSAPFIQSSVLQIQMGHNHEQCNFFALFKDGTIVEFNAGFNSTDNHVWGKIEKAKNKLINKIDPFQKAGYIYTKGFTKSLNNPTSGTYYTVFLPNPTGRVSPKTKRNTSDLKSYFSPKIIICVRGFFILLKQSTNSIFTARLNNNRNILGMLTDEGQMHIFNVNSNSYYAIIESDFGGLRFPCISNDFYNCLTFAGEDNAGYVLNLNQMKILKIEGHKSWVTGVALEKYDQPPYQNMVRIVTAGLDNAFVIYDLPLQEFFEFNEKLENSQGVVSGAVIKLINKNIKIIDKKYLSACEQVALDNPLSCMVNLNKTYALSLLTGRVELLSSESVWGTEAETKKNTNESSHPAPEEKSNTKQNFNFFFLVLILNFY